MFLYESLEKGVEAKKARTVMEEVEAGGLIGWVIVALGALASLMALARVALLLRAAANTNKLTEEIRPLLEKRNFQEAIARCKRAKNASGRVLVATLQNLDRDRQELEDIISEAVLHEQPALDRFGSAIIVVAAVAPLLGLLGTVTGMIATFDIITEFGTGNPKLLSGGISIALVTTELGLVVAIPALIIGNLLSGWAETIKDGLDKAALRVVNIASGIKLSKRPSLPPQEELSETAGSALAGA
jgi:biopolymer transport protein ExbB